jgi:hypothetical protein
MTRLGIVLLKKGFELDCDRTLSSFGLSVLVHDGALSARRTMWSTSGGEPFRAVVPSTSGL